MNLSLNPMCRYRKLKSVAISAAVDRRVAAKFLGISYQLVVSIENGSRGITRKTAEKIVADADVGSQFDKGDLLCWDPVQQNLNKSDQAA